MNLHAILDIALFAAVVATAWYAKALRALVGTLAVRVMAVSNDMLRDRAAYNKELDRLRRELALVKEECRKVKTHVLVQPHDAWTEAENEMLKEERA